MSGRREDVRREGWEFDVLSTGAWEEWDADGSTPIFRAVASDRQFQGVGPADSQVVPFVANGRHAVQRRADDTGRHTCKIVRLVPRT